LSVGWCTRQNSHFGFSPARVVSILINFLFYIVFPLFILFAVWEAGGSLTSGAKVILSGFGVVAIGAFASFLEYRVSKQPIREVFLPVTFMNSMYLALPVNLLISGKQSFFCVIMYNLAITLAHFTVGIWIVAKGSSSARFLEIFKLPMIYAVALGFLFRMSKVATPAVVEQTHSILNSIVPVLMLGLIGFQLSQTKSTSWLLAARLSVWRFSSGIIGAIIMVSALSLSGIPRTTVFISSCMPTAINTYIVAGKYKASPGLAAATIVISTIICLLGIIIYVAL